MAPSLLSKSQNRVMKEKGNVSEEIKNSWDPARLRVNKRNTTLWAKTHYQLPCCTGWGTHNWWASGIRRGYLFISLSTGTDSCNFSDPKAFLETGGLLWTAWYYSKRGPRILSDKDIKTGCRDHTAKEASPLAMTGLECVICSTSACCYKLTVLIQWGEAFLTWEDGTHHQHRLLYSLQTTWHFSTRIFLY